MSFELFVGRRYLKAKQKQAFISLITILSIAGVCVGVMALIIVIAVMSGFESDLKQRILGVEAHLVLMKHGNRFNDYQKILSLVESTSGVISATPFIYSQAMIRSSYNASGAVLRGIDPASADKVLANLDRPLLNKLSAQDNQTDESQFQPPGIILGNVLANNLGVDTGDTIYLVSPKGMISPFGHLPSMSRFQVVGTFESGMYEYDGTLGYVSIEQAQKMLRMKDAITGIEIKVDDIYQARAIGKEIINILGFPYWVRDWMQMNKNLFEALRLEKTVMFIILTLIVLVAAFNIASTLIMTVMEKTKDIAILKAMGATNASIRKIFVFKGMVIGFFGTGLGVSLGVLICVLLDHYKFIPLDATVYYLKDLPVNLDPFMVFVIAFAALCICFVATLYPAHQAAKLKPVDAIRYG